MRNTDRVLVVVSGAATLAAYVALNHGSARLGSPVWFLLVGVGAAAYLAIVARLVLVATAFDRGALLMALVLAGAFRVPFLLTGPGGDVYRYVWDARLQRLGYNPYLVIPSDPAVAGLHNQETSRVNHPDLPSPYPPGAQLIFRLIFALDERAQAIKLALAIADVILVFVLWRWCAAAGVSPGWLLAYAWSPLVILTTAGEGHIDLLGAAWLMVSIFLLTRGRPLTSVLCLTMAIATKLLPIVLVPLYWRRVRLRDGAIGAALFIGLYLPYLDNGRVPLGSLGVFLQEFKFNQTVFTLISALFGAGSASIGAAAAGFLVAVVLRQRTRVTDPIAWAWPMATAILLSPVVYPWYLVWLAPFFLTVATLPLLAWSVTVLSTYAVWHLSELGRPWVVPPPILTAEYGIALAVAFWAIRAQRRNQGLESDCERTAGI